MRRGHGSLYDIAVPGYKANLSDVLASIALVQLDKVERHAEIRRRHVALYDEGARRPRRASTPVARDERDVHANHLYVVRIDAELRRDRDDVPAGADRREHRHVDPLPARAPADAPTATGSRRISRRCR